MSPQENTRAFILDRPTDNPRSYMGRIASSISPHLFRLLNKRLLAVHDIHSYISEIEKFYSDLNHDRSGYLRFTDEILHHYERLQLISDLGEPEIALELLSRIETACDRMLEADRGESERNEFSIHFFKSSILAFRANISDQAGFLMAADKYYKEAIAYRLKCLGEEYFFAVQIMSNQACMYLCHGKLEDAEAAYQAIPLEFREDYGKNSVSTLSRLRMLADKYHFRGREDLAVRALKLSCMIATESSGVEKDMILSLQNEYGQALLNVGRFADAQECFESSLEQYKSLGDKTPSQTIYKTICNNLALAMWRQGMPERANSFLNSSKLDTPTHGENSNIDSTRAMLACELGQVDEFLLAAQYNAASLMKRIGEYWHWPDIANAYHNYAGLLHTNGQADRALSMYCVALRFLTASSQQACSLATLNNIACLIGHLGDRKHCLNILHFVLDRRNIYLEPDHPDITLSLANLAYWYFRSGDLAQSLAFSGLALVRDLNYIYHKYSLLPQSMRLEALRSFGGIQHRIYEIASMDASAMRMAYWTRINRHGILQSLEKSQMQLIRGLPDFDSRSKELVSVYSELRQPNLCQDRRIHLLERQDSLEKSIYKCSPLPGLQTVSLEELFDAIPHQAILLEFVCTAKDRAIEYRVFASNRESGLLSFDFISDAEVIDKLVAKALFALSNGLGEPEILLSQISQVLFAPLASRLEGLSQVYITFDGSLHQLPLLALPHWQNSANLLSDTYGLTILTSSRDLLARVNSSSVISRPVVVVATDFRDPPPLSDQLKTRGSEGPTSFDLDLVHGTCEDIPYAGLEGKAIASILSAELISDSHASVDFLASLSSPRILHLAAHGVYGGEQVARFFGSESTEAQAVDKSAEHNVMESLRSTGIILGADSDRNCCAFLSALEIARLDLIGTELVVLSACDTGLVSVAAGEGVYGLERALIVAGAHAMLLSLWKVPDAATCDFMIRLYTLLKAGSRRLDALLTVQQEFRAHQNLLWRDPYYWAAWQLIGDGGAIEGL